MVSALIGGVGVLFGEMSDRDQGAGLKASIEHARGKATATTGSGSGEGDRRQRGQNSGELGTGKGGGVSGPKEGDGTGAGPKKEEKISKIKLGNAEDLSLTDLDPSEVIKRIRGKYLDGIKRCHQRVLKVDPKAEGRVTIRPTGRVTKADVKGFDPNVDACIKGQATQWRFTAPKDDGKPTSANFEVPLLLKPGGQLAQIKNNARRKSSVAAFGHEGGRALAIRLCSRLGTPASSANA